MSKRLAVIGAGSTYTPELVSGLMRERERLEIEELMLHDIDGERLDVVGGLAKRMLARQEYGGTLALTTELDRALDGADIVLIQLRVGGQAARLRDETIPAACGCVGQETTGAGGLAKALRTVPVILEVAERTRQLAARDAWIIDFTNPVGIVTRALLDAGHRAIGLCNVAVTLQRHIAAHLGIAPVQVVVDQVGLNHLTWIRAVWVDGSDVLGQVIDSFGDALAQELELPRRLLDELGAIPSYYLRYFYAEREVVREQRVEPPRAQVVANIERRLLELYRDPSLAEKPALLEQRGGAFYSEAAVQLVASLSADTGDVQVVDVRNEGTLGGLADDDVVEVPARVGSGGATPLAQKPLAPELLGLVQHAAAYERLAATAGRTQDPSAARLALLTNPLVREWGLSQTLLEQLVLPEARRRRTAPVASAADMVLAVDGGNVKTDLALVDTDGRLLSLVRGGRGSPHHIGVAGCVGLLERLVEEAVKNAGLEQSGRLHVASAQVMIAGADLPEELDALRRAIEPLGWGERLSVETDTFPMLRSGTDRGWGVAVVCGGGINCLGVAPDGRQMRFPALGAITGDWGGGYDVGVEGLRAAARSADGRGPKTLLEVAVPEYFNLPTPLELARAVHLGRMPEERLADLARVVFASAADGDSVAAGIVDRQVEEIVVFATTALRSLDLTDEDADVVLGGGLIRAAPRDLIEQIEQGVRHIAPNATVIVAPVAPIVGAALLGLDELAATPEAHERTTSELQDAFLAIESDSAYVVPTATPELSE